MRIHNITLPSCNTVAAILPQLPCYLDHVLFQYCQRCPCTCGHGDACGLNSLTCMLLWGTVVARHRSHHGDMAPHHGTMRHRVDDGASQARPLRPRQHSSSSSITPSHHDALTQAGLFRTRSSSCGPGLFGHHAPTARRPAADRPDSSPILSAAAPALPHSAHGQAPTLPPHIRHRLWGLGEAPAS